MRTKFRTRLEYSKTGLVCSGGASKAAAFHIGVCLALRDKGFSFVGGKSENPAHQDSVPYPKLVFHPNEIATYVGSSAGAMIVAMLASGIKIESVINSFSDDNTFHVADSLKKLPRITYRDMLSIDWPTPTNILKNFKKSSLFGKTLESMVLRNIRLPGLFTTRGLAGYLRNHVLPTEKFHELIPDLFIVGTQLDHSRKIIFGRYGTEKIFDDYSQYASNAPISDAVAASMSLPVIYTPYLIDHDGKQRYYIDGEIRETLSTHVAKDNGCDLLICSYTHQPYHFKEEIGSLYHYGLGAVVVQALYQAIEQKVYGARKTHENKLMVLHTVREFFRNKKYPEKDLQELTDRLQEKLEFKEKLNYIFIHPEAKDREMFFGEHFTLNPKTLQSVVTVGYRRAMAELRRYELVPKS